MTSVLFVGIWGCFNNLGCHYAVKKVHGGYYCFHYLIRKCMKRTMLRKNMDMPQPTWVMMVRFFRSELGMVSLRVCKVERLNTFKHSLVIRMAYDELQYRGGKLKMK